MIEYPIKRFSFSPNSTLVCQEPEQFYAGHNLACMVADRVEDFIYDNIIKVAEEAGITDLVVLNREFIITALQNEIKRREYLHE